MLFFDQLKVEDQRLRALAVAVVAGMAVLLSGLWYVQVVSSTHYEASQKRQSFRTVRLPAIRGKILDRQGRSLAENRPSFNINLYLDDVRPLFRNEYFELKSERLRMTQQRRLSRSVMAELEKEARYRAVSNLAFQVSAVCGRPLVLDAERFDEHYRQRRSLPLPILKDLSDEQIARFVVKGTRFPGVELEAQALRAYPHGSLAAHVVGRVQRNPRPDTEEELTYAYRLEDYEGVMGIESAFDRELRGRAGRKSILVNNELYRESEQIWPAPEPGDNVVLTLDLEVQRAAEDALRASGPRTRGSVVVMDVRNGDVLALASAPAFDPNAFVPGISHEEYERLRDPVLLPMFNRATQGTYPPGSVFKIIVALAAFENGLLDPKEQFLSKGYYRVTPRSRPIGDTAGPGLFDFRRAFLKSSNPYFIRYGLEVVGPRKLVEMGRQFRLGERTGISLSPEAQGYFPREEPLEKRWGGRWYPGDTANFSIGQGEILVTPLQVAVMTAAVANGGTVLQPRLVSRIEGQDRTVPRARALPPRIVDQVPLSPKYLGLVHEAMVADVEDGEGTGKRARVPGLRIGGKTGTAESWRVREGRRIKDYITWFVAFAPVDDPKYAVTVMVVSGQSGGDTCAPVAREVFKALQRMERAPGGGELTANF